MLRGTILVCSKNKYIGLHVTYIDRHVQSNSTLSRNIIKNVTKYYALCNEKKNR